MTEAELILNADGSIYHLNLLPEQLAPTVFLVGDPDRVPKVSRHFDRIEHRVQKREFVTHTGELRGRRVSVVSTGIGADNVDIVLNELDALVNVDFRTRQPKTVLTSLQLIRLGTSGSLSEAVPLDSFLVSCYGIGLDQLQHFYQYEKNESEAALAAAFDTYQHRLGLDLRLGVAAADAALAVFFEKKGMTPGITLTCPGFYGPQGRRLRLGTILPTAFFKNASRFDFEGMPLTNFEMETAAIYTLARLFGHRAVSCNAILAHRMTGEFSKNPGRTEERLIKEVLGSDW